MKKFICVVCMFLIIVGILRVAFGTYASTGQFIPSYDQLIEDFGKMPDVPQMFANDFATINLSFNTLTNNFTKINDLISFFIAIGNFFQLIWQVIVLVVDTLLIPINWLMWLFSTLFGLNTTVTFNS